MPDKKKLARRPLLVQTGAASAGALALASGATVAARMLGAAGGEAPHGTHTLHAAPVPSGSVFLEVFPTSPLILDPFTKPLDPLKAERPIAQSPAAAPNSWRGGTLGPSTPNRNQQDSDGATHSVWPGDLGLPDPLIYQIKVQVAPYQFAGDRVLPIDSMGRVVTPPVVPATGRPAVTPNPDGSYTLPDSTIYGFNGTFAGVRINAEYGKPCILRFENRLDENPKNFDRADYGTMGPAYGFLTHLHNGHTAPESDGNPFYRHMQSGQGGYLPRQWVDNLYLNVPAGDDDREKQSFFWFHDHFHSFTSADVYKGLVGIYPIYDPVLDPGDETDLGSNYPKQEALHLPGRKRLNGDGSFDADYDIPLVFYDCRMDDGMTPHQDMHSGNGETHPEWWGKTFFKHFPDHGFVGDVFTVNGRAFPVLEVKRRKYRLRFLDASVSRIYEFKLMSSADGPVAAKDLGYRGDELQGQYRLPDGQPCMQLTQIATDGGLLTEPVVRNSFELWPAKRREFVLDFTTIVDTTTGKPRPTVKGDVLYLTNVMKMTTGRMWDASSRFSPDPNYKIPVLKIVIGDDPPATEPDRSVMPKPGMKLRDLWSLPAYWQTLITNRRVFELQRGSSSLSAEFQWLINGQPFDTDFVNGPLAKPRAGSWEAWEIKNGGGGWVHPMHMHMEEHLVVMRNGNLLSTSLNQDGTYTPIAPPDPTGHPDDLSREDVVALDPGESVVFLRRFRTFAGLTKTGTSFLSGKTATVNGDVGARYVAHCHNLTHEDHAMMFGWEIVP